MKSVFRARRLIQEELLLVYRSSMRGTRLIDCVHSTVQEKGAHLLYFTIKDHPFADGNKRIGLLLFLEYLRLNDLLLLPNGLPRLTESAVVALALLIAESEPKQKVLMISLTVSLLETHDGTEH